MRRKILGNSSLVSDGGDRESREQTGYIEHLADEIQGQSSEVNEFTVHTGLISAIVHKVAEQLEVSKFPLAHGQFFALLSALIALPAKRIYFQSRNRSI